MPSGVGGDVVRFAPLALLPGKRIRLLSSSRCRGTEAEIHKNRKCRKMKCEGVLSDVVGLSSKVVRFLLRSCC